MARKFNTGRQSEITLNKDLHDLLMSIRYINNGADEPIQDLQTPIPVGSVWNDINKGKNVLKVNTATKGWSPVFEGYYHPADLFTKPLNPVHGQLWIDGSKDNTLHFYDENTNAWIAVRAASTTSNQILVDMHNNFLHMFPLKDMNNNQNSDTFLVPHEPYGKLTNDGVFIHPSSDEYSKDSDISVSFNGNSDKLSWVHVNPHKLFTMEKKLVKLDGSDKIYGLFDNNTEFYYLTDEGWRHMMPYDALNPNNSDFKAFDQGIELISDRVKSSKYVMIYAYSFYDTARPGKLIRKDFEIGSSSEVHIGLSTKHPMVFVDGLYLEQSKYDYNSRNGNITIHDEIINPMDLMALVFKQSEVTDFAINQTLENSNDALIGTLKNTYVKPMVFVSGVMGAEFFNPEQIIYNRDDKTIIIKNWGPHQPNDISYVMVVEADDLYVTHGKFDNTKSIKHDSILGEREQYMVYTDGILVSSRDLDISQGEVRINNAIEGMEYLLLKIKDESETALLFDGRIMNYTIAIKNEDDSLYNECTNACVFVDGHALMTSDTVLKTVLPIKGAQGQIVKIKNTDEADSIYKYYIYNDLIATWETLSEEDIVEVEELIKADYSSGSIMINAPEGSTKGTYYAYTYANAVEEPLLVGYRTLEEKELYAVNVQHKFNNNTGALTVYTNRLYNHEVKEEASNTGKFIVPILDNITDMYPVYNGSLMYIIERPEKTESAACMKEVLTAANRTTDYDNGYTTSISLMPGVVSVYLNGVRLERNNFTIIDDHTIMLHTPSVGGQRNYNPEDKTTWNKYLYHNSKGEFEITSLRDDIIVIEVRQDFNLKTQSVPVRYPGQRIFYLEDDGLPKSLLLSQDYIKIYIDGVIYDGEYSINKENGSITLLDSELEAILNIDPIARYFETHPLEYDEYLQEHGKAYIAKPQTNIITFEWR